MPAGMCGLFSVEIVHLPNKQRCSPPGSLGRLAAARPAQPVESPIFVGAISWQLASDETAGQTALFATTSMMVNDSHPVQPSTGVVQGADCLPRHRLLHIRVSTLLAEAITAIRA